ncbi:hypothetical protein EC988_002118 [Linderina pennispora]|nr:hypothetical protein EC988_002118 [Linderina pennispora]
MSQSELSPSSSSASLRDAAVRKPSSSRSIRMRAKHLGISADARPSTVSNDSTETTYMKRPAVGALGEYDPVPPLRLTGKQSARKAPPYEWRSAAEAARSEFTAVPTKPVQPSTLRRESDLSFMTNASTDSISWQPHSIKPLLPLKQPTDHPDHVVQQDGVHESAVRRKLLPSLQPQTRLLTQPQRLAQPQVVPVQTQLTPLKHSRSMAYAKPKTQFPRLADNSSRQSLQSSTSHYVPALMPLASSKESDAIYCQSQITLVSQSSKSSKHSVVPPLLPLATSKEKSEEEQRQKQPQKKALPPLSPLKSTAAKFEPFNQIQQPTGMKTVPVIRRARKISVSSGRSTCVESVLTEVARKSTEAGSDFEQCEPLVSRMRAAGLEITRVAEQDFYDYCVDELLKASTEAFHDVSSMISETLAEEIFFSFNNHLNELLASSR